MSPWGFVILYTLFIYASLPFARGVQQSLRALFGGQLGLLINFLLLVPLLFLGLRVLRLSPKKRFLFVLLSSAALGFAMQMEIPEERIHLLEYGLLGALLLKAMSLKMVPRLRFGTALVLGTMIGLGDEGIQWLLPDRVFDWWDVAYNVAGLLLGGGLFHIFARPKAPLQPSR